MVPAFVPPLLTVKVPFVLDSVSWAPVTRLLIVLFVELVTVSGVAVVPWLMVTSSVDPGTVAGFHLVLSLKLPLTSAAQLIAVACADRGPPASARIAAADTPARNRPRRLAPPPHGLAIALRHVIDVPGFDIPTPSCCPSGTDANRVPPSNYLICKGERIRKI